MGLHSRLIRPWLCDLTLRSPNVTDGYLETPDSPGLGIELNERAFEGHPLKRWHRPFIDERDGGIGFQKARRLAATVK